MKSNQFCYDTTAVFLQDLALHKITESKNRNRARPVNIWPVFQHYIFILVTEVVQQLKHLSEIPH